MESCYSYSYKGKLKDIISPVRVLGKVYYDNYRSSPLGLFLSAFSGLYTTPKGVPKGSLAFLQQSLLLSVSCKPQLITLIL